MSRCEEPESRVQIASRDSSGEKLSDVLRHNLALLK
jgi:hypothetical protein